MSFDPSSGLVFTERSSGNPRSMVPTWMTHARGKRIDPSKYRNRFGTSTLKQMVLRYCLFNIDAFTPEALKWLGWHFASQIYHHLKSTDTWTFNAWDIFMQAFPEHIDRNQQFYVYENGISAPLRSWEHSMLTQLPSVVNRLKKIDTSILSFLHIQRSPLVFDNLMRLTEFDGLATLILEDGTALDRDMDDTRERQLRNWERTVTEKGSFQKLKVLVFYSSRLPRSSLLRRVSSFPVLTLIGTDGTKQSKGNAQDTSKDWRRLQPTPTDTLSTQRDPSTIWNNPRITTSSKMQQLYDFSDDSHRSSRPANSPTMTIVYAGDNNRSVGTDGLVWYCREKRRERSTSSKRPADNQVIPNQMEDAKKRKLARNNKKTDVGSLLGTFF
ncbi:hypothetical protein IQ07DRAFT_281076 [Pyrenochaeta sp. DS3sAY3a]|nr:hypothetical protein IQ07DRAFT_281076 [Pyrenochaeta sp. DS3sAY3a]